MTTQVVWIQDDKSLSDYCKQWLSLSFITLDTEFLRETTFYPIAGLIQLSDGQTPFLIDPLAISDWSAFAELMHSHQVVKVLHACNEDIELLYQLTGVISQRIFDTQLAAAFLNMGITLGYSSLVEQLLHININKQEKRSDWLKRPLSQEQEQYAAADVVYLVDLYHYFMKHLSAEKLAWLFEETADIVKRYAHLPDPETLYMEARQSWRLSRLELAVLKALYRWREHEARTHNIARSRLAKDSTLLALAKSQPRTLNALTKTPELHPQTIRRYGQVILTTIAQALEQPNHLWPSLLPKPLPPNHGKLSKSLKKLTQHIAMQYTICPELLWRRRIIEELLQSGYQTGHYSLPDSLYGWRLTLLGKPFLDSLNSQY